MKSVREVFSSILRIQPSPQASAGQAAPLPQASAGQAAPLPQGLDGQADGKQAVPPPFDGSLPSALTNPFAIALTPPSFPLTPSSSLQRSLPPVGEGSALFSAHDARRTREGILRYHLQKYSEKWEENLDQLVDVFIGSFLTTDQCKEFISVFDARRNPSLVDSKASPAIPQIIANLETLRSGLSIQTKNVSEEVEILVDSVIDRWGDKAPTLTWAIQMVLRDQQVPPAAPSVSASAGFPTPKNPVGPKSALVAGQVPPTPRISLEHTHLAKQFEPSDLKEFDRFGIEADQLNKLAMIGIIKFQDFEKWVKAIVNRGHCTLTPPDCLPTLSDLAVERLRENVTLTTLSPIMELPPKDKEIMIQWIVNRLFYLGDGKKTPSLSRFIKQTAEFQAYYITLSPEDIKSFGIPPSHTESGFWNLKPLPSQPVSSSLWKSVELTERDEKRIEAYNAYQPERYFFNKTSREERKRWMQVMKYFYKEAEVEQYTFVGWVHPLFQLGLSPETAFALMQAEGPGDFYQISTRVRNRFALGALQDLFKNPQELREWIDFINEYEGKEITPEGVYRRIMYWKSQSWDLPKVTEMAKKLPYRFFLQL